MFKACIFDLDGTLADSVESLAHCTNLALKAVGLAPNPVYMYKKFAGDGAKVMVERSLIAAGDTELKFYEKAKSVHKEMYEKYSMYKVKVFDGIMELTKTLKQNNIKIAVLTNKPHERAIDVVTALFGENYFDAIFGQCDDYKRKPSPEGALLIADKFNVTPSQCIYLGDTNTDMQTGKSAGMFTVGVTWGFRDKQELIDNNADYIIDTPMQLMKLFFKH